MKKKIENPDSLDEIVYPTYDTKTAISRIHGANGKVAATTEREYTNFLCPNDKQPLAYVGKFKVRGELPAWYECKKCGYKIEEDALKQHYPEQFPAKD